MKDLLSTLKTLSLIKESWSGLTLSVGFRETSKVVETLVWKSSLWKRNVD